jgi:hypothetical protein
MGIVRPRHLLRIETLQRRFKRAQNRVFFQKRKVVVEGWDFSVGVKRTRVSDANIKYGSFCARESFECRTPAYIVDLLCKESALTDEFRILTGSL